MKFCCFTPVPWPHLDRRPESWPFPSDTFDAAACARLYDETVEHLVEAERCGFDWVGLGEDHMTAYGLTPNPLQLLSVVAAQTTRVRLVTMGCPLPLLNPLRVAEELATLDVLSRGRVIAGLIRGVPQNYAAYHVDPNESRARFAEGLALVERAWASSEVFAWESEHYTFPSVSLWPRPWQEPHPPLLLSANSETSARFGARKRAMIAAIHLYNLDAIDRVKNAFDAYRDAACESGWTAHDDRFVIGFQTCIAPTDQEARDILAPALDYQYTKLSGTYDKKKREIAATKPGYGLSPTEEHPPTLEERISAGTVLCGSPESVAGQIDSLRSRLGVGVISMHLRVGNIAHEHAQRGLRLFQAGVLPGLQPGAAT